MIVFHTARLETRNFTFTAYGPTLEITNEVMRRTFEKHCSEYHLSLETFMAEFWESVEVQTLVMGGGYRDRQEIYRP